MRSKVPDGIRLVPEEPVLQLDELGHGGVVVDELGPVEVHRHVQDAVDRHAQVR